MAAGDGSTQRCRAIDKGGMSVSTAVEKRSDGGDATDLGSDVQRRHAALRVSLDVRATSVCTASMFE